MHIADGILPTLWCGAAHAVAWPGVWAATRRLDPPEIVRMGLLASAVFTISLFHFPLGGTSVHLGLYGLTGILCGRRAFAVIVAALLLQSFLFQHGGLLSLGINALNMGAGALAASLLWRRAPGPESARAFLCGAVGILIPAFLLATEFALARYGKGWYALAAVYLGAALLEGAVTAAIVAFFRRSRPALLAGPA